MFFKTSYILYAVFLFSIQNQIFCAAWDTEELEIFDVVEEINKNFYEFMGLTHDASLPDIKRAFRNLSIILHPDKSDAEDANIQFRNLVSIYEILKDKSKREKYDKVLKEGLPNWKSALYYYRRYKKMGLTEGALILFIIITIGQYFFAWAAYLEKIYTAEQIFGSKIRKLQKKNKTNVELDTILNEIPYPSVFNTLPFQLPKLVWNIPKNVKQLFLMTKEYSQQKIEQKKLEEEEAQHLKELEEEAIKERQNKKEMKEVLRKRKQASRPPTKTEEELAGYSQLKLRNVNDGESVKPVQGSKMQQIIGGLWTDDDLIELIHLVKKYPGGAANRWDVIGEAMNRSVTEVTFMAAKLKENGYRLPGQKDTAIGNDIQVLETKKTKTKNDNTIVIPESSWTQVQQKALESAIMQHKKTNSTDRWQKISNCVPDKTKEECLLRYKYLVELVKVQKETQNIGDDTNKEPIKSVDAEENNKNNTVNDKDIELNYLEGYVNSDKLEDNLVDFGEDDECIAPVKGGKPKNKRKERKKHYDCYDDSSDE